MCHVLMLIFDLALGSLSDSSVVLVCELSLKLAVISAVSHCNNFPGSCIENLYGQSLKAEDEHSD